MLTISPIDIWYASFLTSRCALVISSASIDHAPLSGLHQKVEYRVKPRARYCSSSSGIKPNMGLLGHPKNIFQSQHSQRRRRVCVGLQLDDVRDRGRLPCCDSLGVRRGAKNPSEAVLWELDRFDKEGVARVEGDRYGFGGCVWSLLPAPDLVTSPRFGPWAPCSRTRRFT